mmetsp:Transcript_22402/g.33997  ORF Transcript_22402/g.33997 Transcript_22402/m.33997 type:complete len:559 (+) Transcript_22402:136-1812(+)|eukprot:CAMPEP_0194199736 /NCGR_PEP_ID=MMETSP0156-20130528/639_1 /TAXON_ID=33649 /ORGANISM="Thalassionema nitzschioides, Strain L26-B" /LENGTH=558 /DNA_ID=CAMNT_0038924671 /DNA_START=109 /DNA_END=1788 /DNA_ORIENTATION=-
MSSQKRHFILLTFAIILFALFTFDLSSRISSKIHTLENNIYPLSTKNDDSDCFQKSSSIKERESSALAMKIEMQRYDQELLILAEKKNMTEVNLLALKDRLRGKSIELHSKENVMKIGVSTGIIEDNFKEGKSCRRSGYEWICRDCDKTIGKHGMWESCLLIDPHGECNYWKAGAYDEPLPRVQTYHDKNALHDALRYAVLRHGHPEVYEQYPCFQLHNCFDMDKCQNSTSPLKIFIYDEYMGIEKSILKELEGSLQGVAVISPPVDACLFVVTPRSFARNSKFKLFNSSLWNEGRNHFLYQSHRIKFIHDHFDGENFQRASLSGPNFQHSDLRVGYDVPLYFGKQKHPLAVNENIYNLVQNQVHRSRRYLVTYQDVLMPTSLFFFHGWLASEYWPRDDPEIFVDIQCHKNNDTKTQGKSYVENIMNSTFVFCPGSHFAGSPTFGEALALGAIPVVTTEFAEPFYPEVDWSGCLVKVNEGRIIDLPRKLRSMTRDSVASRQGTCMELFHRVIGWNAHEDGTTQIDLEGRGFAVAMRLWKLRIEVALERKKRQKEFLDD